MARPNNFIMNTDYLSIAQYGKYQHTYVISGGSTPSTTVYQDFTVPASNGSIDQIMISLNDGPFKLGLRYAPSEGGHLDIYRVSANTLRAEMTFADTPTHPLYKFTIKALCFKPPNVF